MGRFLNAVLITAGCALAQPALAADAMAANLVAGSHLFKAQCGICHAVTAGGPPGVGPSLADVVGRHAGTQVAFRARYSAAMKGAGKTWTDDNLKLYIANPAKAVPGNQMPFAGLHDTAQVANVVAYLGTLH